MLTLLANLANRFRNDEEGASMVEYALLVVLIAIVAIVAIQLAGTAVSSTFQTVANALGG